MVLHSKYSDLVDNSWNFCLLFKWSSQVLLLQVHVKRSVKGKDSALPSENGSTSNVLKTLKPPIVRKGKLVVVDLAGSNRMTSQVCFTNNVYYLYHFVFPLPFSNLQVEVRFS